MAHTLVLDVPENVFDALVKTAHETGRSPEELAAEWLANAAQSVEDDPFEKWIGAHSSDIRGWADEHDKYIGAQVLESMRDAKSDDHPDG